MSQTVLILVGDPDLEAARALARALDAFAEINPVVCAMSANQGRLVVGDNVAAVAVWSQRAHAAGLGPSISAAMAQNPKSSLLWRLDDAPWPDAGALDAGMMAIGPHAGGIDAQAAANAARLCVRRISGSGTDAPQSVRSETPAWPALVIGVAIVGGLAAAGYAAWRSGPPPRVLTVERPYTPPAAAPTPAGDTEAAPTEAADAIAGSDAAQPARASDAPEARVSVVTEDSDGDARGDDQPRVVTPARIDVPPVAPTPLRGSLSPHAGPADDQKAPPSPIMDSGTRAAPAQP